MFKLDEIRIKRAQDSKVKLSEVEKFLQEKLKIMIPPTEFIILKDNKEVNAVLRKPISFQKFSKILKILGKKQHITEFSWKANNEWPGRTGTVFVVIS